MQQVSASPRLGLSVSHGPTLLSHALQQLCSNKHLYICVDPQCPRRSAPARPLAVNKPWPQLCFRQSLKMIHGQVLRFCGCYKPLKAERVIRLNKVTVDNATLAVLRMVFCHCCVRFGEMF